MAAHTKLTITPARLAGGALLSLATTWLVNRVVTRGLTKRSKPQTDPNPAADWEREALAAGQVGVPEGRPVAFDASPIGRGDPSEHCLALAAAGEAAELGPHCVFDPVVDPRFAPVDRGAPPATIPSSSTWPVLTKHASRLVVSYWTTEGARGYSGRAFAAKREDDDGNRHHAGVDLFARAGDIVVAPEDGTVLAILPFNAGTWAIYLRSLLGDRVVNLGELEPYSWREFGLAPGRAVVEGQPLGRIGVQSGGSTMLHLETLATDGAGDSVLLDEIRSGALSWPTDKPAPPRLRDPSGYLLTAASRTYRRAQLT